MDQKQEPNQAFLQAVFDNDPPSITLLFKTKFYPDYDHASRALSHAAEKGYLKIVNLLVDHEKFNLVTLENPLELALQNGHMEIVNALLFKKQPDRYAETRMHSPDLGFIHPFLWAIRKNCIPIVELYINKDWRGVHEMHNSGHGIFQQAYDLAIVLQRMEILTLLLDDDRICRDMQDNVLSPLVKAVKTGNLALVDLLLEDGILDASDHKNAAFNKACELGHLDIVKLLVGKYHVLPYDEEVIIGRSSKNSPEERFQNKTFYGLGLAMKHKHSHVVEYLLDLPNMPLPGIFLESARNNMLDLIRLLLPRVDPRFNKSQGLRIAARHGNHEIVQCLLDDKRSQPQVYHSQALREAAEHGHIQVVKILLNHSKVDPGAIDNSALSDAIKHKHVEIIKMLMAHPKVDSGARQNTLLGLIAEQNWVEILERLSLQKIYDAANNSTLTDKNKNALKIPKMLTTYSLFRCLEPSLPKELNHQIRDFMMASLKQSKTPWLLPTYSLFRCLEPSLPEEINHKIGGFMTASLNNSGT